MDDIRKQAAEVMARELDRVTEKVAQRHGCDRGVFSVCWAEHERGEICRCKEEARAMLAATKENPNG